MCCFFTETAAFFETEFYAGTTLKLTSIYLRLFFEVSTEENVINIKNLKSETSYIQSNLKISMVFANDVISIIYLRKRKLKSIKYCEKMQKMISIHNSSSIN